MEEFLRFKKCLSQSTEYGANSYRLVDYVNNMEIKFSKIIIKERNQNPI